MLRLELKSRDIHTSGLVATHESALSKLSTTAHSNISKVTLIEVILVFII